MNVSLSFPRPQVRFSSLSSSAAGKAADNSIQAKKVTTINDPTVLAPFKTFLQKASGSLIIGRAEDNKWKLTQNFLSRKHFRVVIDTAHNIFIEDLQSAIGTGIRNESGNLIQLKPNTLTPYDPTEDTIVLGGFFEENRQRIEIPPFMTAKDFETETGFKPFWLK